jgi:hypothetical protein
MAAPYSFWARYAGTVGKVSRLGLLRRDRREGRNQLVDILAAAVRALDFSFVDVSDMVMLGEFLVTVLAMKRVLRHGDSPVNMIALMVFESCGFERGAPGLLAEW